MRLPTITVKGDRRAALDHYRDRVRLLTRILGELATRRVKLIVFPGGFFTVRPPNLKRLLKELGTLLRQYPQITICAGVDVLSVSFRLESPSKRKGGDESFVYVFQKGKEVLQVRQFTETSKQKVPQESLRQPRTFACGTFTCGVIVCGEVFGKVLRSVLSDAEIIINPAHGSVSHWDIAAASWSKPEKMRRGFFFAQHLKDKIYGSAHDYWGGARLPDPREEHTPRWPAAAEMMALTRIYEVQSTGVAPLERFAL